VADAANRDEANGQNADRSLQLGRNGGANRETHSGTSGDDSLTIPLLFSYGTLQQESVQLSTFGRRLSGQRDELPRFERSSVQIGKTHHANVKFNGNEDSRVPGTAFEITDDELASSDAYEAAFTYERVIVTLTSGRQAWVYKC
jgi:hypothetical protein